VPKSILMACSQYWNSPFQVGSHHLARAYAEAGWRVGYLSHPISPLHWLKPNDDLKDRVAIHRSGGVEDAGGSIWAYVPWSALSPANRPMLRSHWLHEHWSALTMPSLLRVLRDKEFAEVDVIYFDHPVYHKLLRQVRHAKSVYRIADFMVGFDHVARPMVELERRLANAVDLVVYPSSGMQDGVLSYSPKRHLHLSNGVNCRRFTEAKPRPADYRDISGPICVYVGAIEDWFDHELVVNAARALPTVTFVIIGPVPPGSQAGAALSGIANIRLLGRRMHTALPAFLQHANVGIIPFAAQRRADIVKMLNPLKMYEYFACGLPCVSTAWPELERISPPATIAKDEAAFITGIEHAISKPPPREKLTAYARTNDWAEIRNRLQNVLDEA
jgi:glycosyltransferase involved in cell wall biosynthesis